MKQGLFLIIVWALLALPALVRANCGCGCSCGDPLGYQSSASVWFAKSWPSIDSTHPGAQVAIDFSLDDGAHLKIANSAPLSEQTLTDLAKQIAADLGIKNPYFELTYNGDYATANGFTLDLQPLAVNRPGQRTLDLDLGAIATILNRSALRRPIGIVVDSRTATTSTLTTRGQERSLPPYWFTSSTDLARNGGRIAMQVALSWRSVTLMFGGMGIALLFLSLFFLAPLSKAYQKANPGRLPVSRSFAGPPRYKNWTAFIAYCSLLFAILTLFDAIIRDAGIETLPFQWNTFWAMLGAALCVSIGLGVIYRRIPPLKGYGKEFRKRCRQIAWCFTAITMGTLLSACVYVTRTVLDGFYAAVWLGTALCVAAATISVAGCYFCAAYYSRTIKGEWIDWAKNFLKWRNGLTWLFSVIDRSTPDAWIENGRHVHVTTFLTKHLSDAELKVVICRLVAPTQPGDTTPASPGKRKAVIIGITFFLLTLSVQIYISDLGYLKTSGLPFPVYFIYPFMMLWMNEALYGKPSTNPITQDLYAAEMTRNPGLVLRTIQKLDALEQSLPAASRPAPSKIPLETRIVVLQARYPELMRDDPSALITAP